MSGVEMTQVETCQACARYQQQIAELTARIEELERVAATDELTQLKNHRSFDQHLAREMERTRRTGAAMALVMLDIDHFKQVNDTHGHQVGNEVLAQWSQRIQDNVRKLDIACRYGGEEFVVICPATGQQQVRGVAHRLLEACSSTPFDTQAGPLSLTVSIGVEVLYPADGASKHALIERVDEQLYRAKRGGRNQVCYSEVEDVGRINEVSNDEKTALAGLFGEPDPD